MRLGSVPVYRRVKRSPSPLYLSPTSIATFEECRQRYKFLYIDKLGDEYRRPRPYFTMANHVHATLRDFLSLQPPDRRTAAAIEELLHKNWQRYRLGFSDRADELRWMQKALAQVKAFVESYDVGVRPVMMEEALEVKVTPGVVLRGRVDRVDRLRDGSVHIIDYKTGRVPDEVDWVQLELLALLVSRRVSWPVSTVSYLYLSGPTTRTAAMPADRLRRAHWNLLHTAGKVGKEKSFPPMPGFWCASCDFVSICPEKNEAESLAQCGAQLELWD